MTRTRAPARLDRAAPALALLALAAAAAPPASTAGRCAAVHARTHARRARGRRWGRRPARPPRGKCRLDEALAALGAAYASPATIDDSGMRLVLAREAVRRGRLAQAAGLKRRVLAERLHLCMAG